MRKISGELLALAASLALGATTVAAKDDVGFGGGGGGEKMRTRQGGHMRSRASCMRHRWGWAVRVSVAASGTTAAKKSAVSTRHLLGFLRRYTSSTGKCNC